MEAMRIGLHDAENDHLKHKKFPNLALMKISAYHKSRGDAVDWWCPLQGASFDLVYSSKVFDFTPENPYLPAETIRGGTGYPDIPVNAVLPEEIDQMFPDYSIYPDCDYAIGYLTRGCPNHCRWCIVPAKEGGIRPYRRWEQVVRPDTKKLVLMDNNILASDYGVGQLEGLIGTDYALDLNQGMDARLVDDHIAGILAKLNWIRFIRFSCDQMSQLEAIERAADLLEQHGQKPYKLFIYLLITSDVDNAVARVERLKKLKGISIFAQPERNERAGITPDAVQKEFALRYIRGRYYLHESWPEYIARHSRITVPCDRQPAVCSRQNEEISGAHHRPTLIVKDRCYGI